MRGRADRQAGNGRRRGRPSGARQAARRAAGTVGRPNGASGSDRRSVRPAEAGRPGSSVKRGRRGVPAPRAGGAPAPREPRRSRAHNGAPQGPSQGGSSAAFWGCDSAGHHSLPCAGGPPGAGWPHPRTLGESCGRGASAGHAQPGAAVTHCRKVTAGGTRTSQRRKSVDANGSSAQKIPRTVQAGAKHRSC